VRNHTTCVLSKYFDVERYIIQKQRGLCRHCRELFVRTDTVVIRGHPNKKYYHQQCANLLNILWYPWMRANPLS